MNLQYLSALQYLVSGMLSFFVSMYILVKKPRTLALKSLFIFGLVISVWAISTFFNTIAPNEVVAATFWRITIFTSHLGFPIYLFTIINIRNEKNWKHLLIFIPVVAQLFVMVQSDYINNYQFFMTEFGWNYKVIGYSISLVFVSVILITYMISIFVLLYNLIRTTQFPLLKRKYSILLLSYISFQTVGTTLTNALIAFGILHESFGIGGILQFLTFVSIWYVLTLQERELPLAKIPSKVFSQVYSSFLTLFYNSTLKSQLGEDVFKFTEFITDSQLKNYVTLTKKEIIFSLTQDLNIAELIDRNLKFFNNNQFDEELVAKYLRVLNSADQFLEEKLEGVIKANSLFLKETDLLYGVSGGKYLDKISEDTSLRNLEDTEACLKIYKRILLPNIERIKDRKQFLRYLSENLLLKDLGITNHNEILMNEVKEKIQSFTKNQRLSIAIENFNSIVSWMFETILKDPSIDVDEILRKLRLILTLNKDRAVDLGVYPTLLGQLATKIPQTQIYRLYSDYLEELVKERTLELKKTQENLLKSQRLAAFGEIAAMVGHDLRNPLQTIVNTIYLANKKTQKSPNGELKEILEGISEQVTYMNKIVSDLQDYARPLKLNIGKVNFRELIKDILSTIKIPENIKVFIEADEDFPEILVDVMMMMRVMTNLLTNAVQAMPHGGHIKIMLNKNVDYLAISVQDTGLGISKQNVNQIFQPLFSTKSKGLGLGLAVCKRLIEAHKGSILVESKVNYGSTFTIKLPLTTETEPIVL